MLSPASRRHVVSMFVVGAILLAAVLAANAQSAPPASPIVERHEGDDYTRYELQAPETAQFKIVYEVTATRPGARFFFNVIRKGSEVSDEAVFDQMTGQPLPFKVVTGAEARAAGQANADLEANYIQVTLARPVPEKGETRLRIDKTYKDPKSYYREGDLIVFNRGLGIKRNAVVLPPGYELVACNVPSQVLTEGDGRINISFLNASPGEAPLVVRARPLPKTTASPRVSALDPTTRADRATSPVARAIAASGPSMASRLDERAHQDREIVYFLQQPDTHAFALYHDYTESRPGVAAYFNVVRAGSKASSPAARLLDTGEELKVETIAGREIIAAKLDVGDPVQPDSEIVVIRFPAVRQGQSVRLRISETYADQSRYYMEGDQFVWDRSLGRPRNAVVLPAGWYLTASSIPAVVTMTPDGRVRMDYNNARPDEVAVLLKGRKR
ncbi:MAG: hemophore-related protein [Acidobacteria bacterium]|nr:hemophore-related protein [Acidobacteriota bacterium]